jgi:hypothetical protein
MFDVGVEQRRSGFLHCAAHKGVSCFGRNDGFCSRERKTDKSNDGFCSRGEEDRQQQRRVLFEGRGRQTAAMTVFVRGERKSDNSNDGFCSRERKTDKSKDAGWAVETWRPGFCEG